MQDLTETDTIRNLCGRYGIEPSKNYGQNFLISAQVCRQIAEAAVPRPGLGVIEIGPGFGTLTRELSRRAAGIVAIEADRAMIPVLSETLSGFNPVVILQANALDLDYSSLIRERFSGMEVVIASNLPYGITTAFFSMLLDAPMPFTQLTVMIQKEAARRITVPAGSRESSALSLAAEYYTVPEILFDVSRNCFWPQPNVDSSVIRFVKRTKPPVCPTDASAMFRLIRSAFSQRRKTAANSISSSSAVSKQDVWEALVRIGADRNIRPEQLTLRNYSDLSDLIG